MACLPLLVVEHEVSSGFRSWLYRCGLFIVYGDFLEVRAIQAIAHHQSFRPCPLALPPIRHAIHHVPVMWRSSARNVGRSNRRG